MTTIYYSKLSNENFSVNSLDKFIRHQEVTECWRKVNGSYVLVPNEFTEDWDTEKCREIAQTVITGIGNNGFAYGAFSGNEVVGYIYLSKDLFGSEDQYIELQLFHISEPFRRKGIGKKLFKLACTEAKAIGAKKLYISAHSSKESQAAYRSLGCVEAAEVNKEISENEPFDIQMEYRL
ncbi:MAG: GNAT family N-acetyltransferase [Huintestinicola sp.]